MTAAERDMGILERVLQLVKEDAILHNAVVRLLEAKRDAEKARQDWYERRRS